MKIAVSFFQFPKLVIDLVIHDHRFLCQIFQCHAAAFVKRHVPITVQASARIYTNRKGGELLILLFIRACKKIPKRSLHRRELLLIPVDSQNQSPVLHTAGGHPDVLYHPLPADI